MEVVWFQLCNFFYHNDVILSLPLEFWAQEMSHVATPGKYERWGTAVMQLLARNSA
jgi:hypothetical protein